MAVTDEQIIERLRALLAESDLQTTTEKMLRKKLEEEFEMDMLEKKPLIRQEIERYLEEQGGDEESEEDEEEEEIKGKKRVGGLTAVCWLSEPMQKFVGEESMARTQVVKRLWDYIKANNLQDPSNKRNILLDDKLRTIFTPPLTMFSMSKQLSKHVKRLESNPEPRSASKSAAAEKRAASSADAKPQAKKSRASGAGDGEEGEAKKPNNFTKPVRLSAEAAAWCKQESMPRHELTKFFWEYVKERGLQDPKDKRFVLSDAQLKKLTGEDRFNGFSFAKLMASHILKD
ncbi:hypothetical protein Agub_g8332 [Astrephomene gubernaculifera]|uniref:Uncharacterized protein n=1 Tax=Astrephomene gubernaculifera TaxID=47775 RepID=A0AAD3DVR4_9CHLO|nr:hypothetical protein Agub_g8332 [Astrephomene gubernaculifera]